MMKIMKNIDNCRWTQSTVFKYVQLKRVLRHSVYNNPPDGLSNIVVKKLFHL